MTSLLGEDKIHTKALATMRERGGSWAAYQNHAMDSSGLGHLKFLQYGEDCTFVSPPQKLPDMPSEINWMYVLVGYVDLWKGEIKDVPS